MKNIITLSLLLIGSLSYGQVDTHEITYYQVPKEHRSEFIEGYKTITDFNQGEERTVQSSWLFEHAFGAGFTFMSVDVYKSDEESNADKPMKQWRINYEKMSDSEKESFDTMWKSVSQLYFNGHTDERRKAYLENAYFNEKRDPSKRQVVVMSTYDPNYSDRKEFFDLFSEVTKEGVISRGNAAAMFASLHSTGSGSLVSIFTWYNSWEDFAKEEEAIDKASFDQEKVKRFWSIAGKHTDNILRLVGSNYNEEKIFKIN